MKFIAQLLDRHLQRYPRMQLEDVYKLLHQAAMGPGHMLGDTQRARAALESECHSLETGPEELLVDPISPDGRLARVHLRPYLSRGHDLAVLADAFVATPGVCPATPEKLAKFCGCLGDLADAGGIPFTRAQVSPFFDDIAARGYPVVHHSPPFRETYRPAYRVIAIELLPGLG